MSFGGALYKLILGPLELFFETAFSFAYHILGDAGAAIIFFSLAMNFLVLPLYRRADALQAEERDREAGMRPWVTKIKKAFKGDERYMMLRTYYRQCGYKQTDALKGSLSLLLEVPFFIAAYRFLSGLELLRGVSFGPIRDLGAPDAMISLGSVSVNLLPLLMTAVNILSASIYLKGFPLKSKIQLYGAAFIFLVLLYDSPAGLVFYWTLNNLFSLAKNIFCKLKRPGKALAFLSMLAGVGAALFLLFRPLSSARREILALAACALLSLPFPLSLLSARRKARRPAAEAPEPGEKEKKSRDRLFLFCAIALALLTGVMIPASVIASSPAEFVNVMRYESPLRYVVSSALYAFGIFVIWFGVFYKLASEKGKRVMSALVCALACAALVDHLFFGEGFGTLSSSLVYVSYPNISAGRMIVNAAVLLLLSAVLILVCFKKLRFVQTVSLILCLSVLGISVFNVADIGGQLKTVRAAADQAREGEPVISLSKKGQNVVVIMLDRAVSSFLPFIMEEKPELKEAFDGFTYYPNTISYGSNTLVGSPALFGGYEYTPENLNRRSDMLMPDKHNEALKVMPVLFDRSGWSVTVSDPTYAGYGWIPDLSIFDEFPTIRKFITLGKFAVDEYYEPETINDELLDRNFFCHAVFRIAPSFLQYTVYNGGKYNSSKTLGEQPPEPEAPAPEETGASYSTVSQERSGVSVSQGVSEVFMKPYAVLKNLSAITKITDHEKGEFLLFTNDTTHEPMLLKEPEYEPAGFVDNTGYDEEHRYRVDWNGNKAELRTENVMIHYHANAASLLKLADWFDYLRECGVYDNTRIIVVSDHGWSLGDFEQSLYGNNCYGGFALYNPLLLVKDFGATGFHIDDTFMTNADTPALAAEGLIETAANPFSGKTLKNEEAKKGEQHVVYTNDWQTSVNNGYKLLPATWHSVRDNVFDKNNWSKIGDDLVLPLE